MLRICGNNKEERSAFKLVVDERKKQLNVIEADSAPHRTFRQFQFDSIFTPNDYQVNNQIYCVLIILILKF